MYVICVCIMCMFFLHVCIASCGCLGPGKSEKDIESPELKLWMVVSHHACWELNLGLLKLTASSCASLPSPGVTLHLAFPTPFF